MEQDGLATLAEVFIGLAGFTGIALALKPNPKPYFLFRVVLIVSLSFTAIIVAFLPVALLTAGIAEHTIWRVGSGLLAAVYLIIYPFVIRFRRAAKADELLSWVNLLVTCVGGLVFMGQLGNLLGLFGGFEFFALFLGLLGVFLHCAILFIVLITIGRLERHIDSQTNFKN